MNPDPSVVITNTVNATLNILKAASKWPTVKQVVLTSSSTAAYTPNANGERTTITQGASIVKHLSFTTLTSF
jgi:nucleoside-diphosphate-sugar epimerase